MISASINGVVHIFAAVFFISGLFFLLKIQRERALLRGYLRGDLIGRVQVDWPLRFLAHFCSALEIPFHGMGRVYSGRPLKMRKQLLFETLLLYGIHSIEYRTEGRSNIFLKLRTLKEVPNRDFFSKELSSALGVEVKICFPNEN